MPRPSFSHWFDANQALYQAQIYPGKTARTYIYRDNGETPRWSATGPEGSLQREKSISSILRVLPPSHDVWVLVLNFDPASLKRFWILITNQWRYRKSQRPQRSQISVIGHWLTPDSAQQWPKKASIAVHTCNLNLHLHGTWTCSLFGHALLALLPGVVLQKI